MSGSGAPTIEAPRAEGARVAVVAAQWHPKVTDALVAGALRALTDSGVTDHTVVRVPGSFELPVAALHAAKSDYDAVIALGVVIRGDTPHFEYVCQATTDGLMQVGLTTGVPIGFGVLTCDNDPQALDRAGLPDSREDKGYEATQAALSTLVAIRAL
ncbi:6,7-dimethyl-8-ribityllumazine synthase [Kribbella sandramycini]|uniref:6,7-dimethyl-8-ribityllumazine synthase n=1 Tax=Kribbella sandramycini TaxID=60450 RepID=A0A7Y4L3D6_9ACTN|nr:6,7-dimethyl-8-ribityllumazine synthase [Kribbella sandramycini]MBB6571017.1 6,7-dimethyl-8-ribityllumazine synthase [Kribbella sandramycini]NOL43574.1 6,7-dimethyl-8-ribityllumazine synthase [Kribbella sandramycini]